MNTMTLRLAPQAKFAGFYRFGRHLALLLEIFAEAQRMTHEANRQYPFLRW